MALMHELDPTQTTGALTDESRGLKFGELIRDYDPAPDTKWRFGKPNYARVNEAYFKHRAKVHKEGSLESVVSKVVKNWEVESHHISDVNQWKTMVVPEFTARVNNGPACNAQYMCDEGPYNVLMGELDLYSAKANTFASSNTIWSATFPNGFAWECLEVLAGPPKVTFKWRHFGEFSGVFTDKHGVKHQGNGEVINLIGMCIADVSDTLQIKSLDIYYNPCDLVNPLMRNAPVIADSKPADGGDATSGPAPAAGCGCGSPSKEQETCTVM